MPILLCAATTFEIQPTLQWLESGAHPQVSVCITGVGMMAAAYAITKAIHAQRPSLMVQAGIAGCLNDPFDPGEAVLIRSEWIGDLGVEEQGRFQSLAGLGFVTAPSYPFASGELPANHEHLEKFGLPLATGVTVNEITTGEDRLRYYREVLHAEAESMEGAALHYAGLQEGIPFIQLRTFSNRAGERDKKKWRMKEAIDNLNRELMQLILKLNEP
jgi:futalosine hydrolase